MVGEGDYCMTQDFSREKPIYSQLVDRICGDILKGNIQLGDKLPSVREFAVESGVNVNTVQRVYKELEAMGITETRRGQGTFITTNDEKIHTLREGMKEQLANQFLSSIEALGFTKEEMVALIQRKGE